MVSECSKFIWLEWNYLNKEHYLRQVLLSAFTFLIKQKGEVIDAWHRVSLTKVFDDEKEPISSVSIEYDTEGSAF